jgi:hypothetical protein
MEPNLDQEAPAKRPVGRPKAPKRASREVRFLLPKDEHEAIARAAKSNGQTLTSWVAGAAHEALLGEDEKRFSTRLRVVETSADNAAKGVGRLDKRVGDLYALIQSVEADAKEREKARVKELMTRLAALESQGAANVATLEEQAVHLSTGLTILALLLRASDEGRKWFREIAGRSISYQQLLQRILERTD